MRAKAEESVTVVIPAFNSTSTIDTCMASILGQKTDASIEIVVVDDASTDDTWQLLQKYKCLPSVRLLTNDAHRGASFSRNRGIESATGSWLCFVDSDDELPPNAVKHLLEAARSDNVDLVVGSHEKRYRAGLAIINRHGHDDLHPSQRLAFGPESLAQYVEAYALEPYKYTMLVHCWGKLFRRAIVESSGLRFEESLEQLEDVHFVFSFLRCGARVVYVDSVGYCHTIGGASMSTRSGIEPDTVSKLQKAYSAVEAFLNEKTKIPSARATMLVQHLMFTTSVIWLIRIERRLRTSGIFKLRRGIQPIVSSPLIRRCLGCYRPMQRDSRLVYWGVKSGSSFICAVALRLRGFLSRSG